MFFCSAKTKFINYSSKHMLAVVPKYCISKASLETNFALVERKCNVSRAKLNLINRMEVKFKTMSQFLKNALHYQQSKN